MQIAIVQFPGSNCERETMLAVKRAGMEPVEFLWNESHAKLAQCAGYIIVGGFSYEDRSRAGAIAALDPIMQVIKQQSELGKPVLGICNGAQILVETGLVPGLENYKLGMALTDNKRMQQDKILGTGFYNAWVNIRLSDAYQLNAFTQHLTQNDILHMPVAHGEGRFVIPSGLLAEMQAQGLNLFQYCDANGQIIAEFPVNPNGSVDNLAAVSNKMGNVMAMMPHPERTPNGDAIFKSMRDYIGQGYVQRVNPLHHSPRVNDVTRYVLPKANHELLIDLVITDNQAMSVENGLNRQGIPVTVKRQLHWEIECDSLEIYEKIKASGVLFNDRKEVVTARDDIKKLSGRTFLVRSKEDMLGQEKLQMLTDHFDVTGVRAIHHGVLWTITSQDNADHAIDSVLQSHILFNPYAHDCYEY